MDNTSSVLNSWEVVQPNGTRSPRRWLPDALLRLLAYVRPHKKYAAFTVLFGALGFLLSFVYPWIIGSVVDLATEPGTRLPAQARLHRLLELTGYGLVTGVLHALVVYGRGHFNVHLGDAIVADLRRELFAHLQKLSVAFYSKHRNGSILNRILHDVHAATSVIYGGIIVVGLDAAQLLLAFVLLMGVSWKLTLACVVMFPAYGLVFATMNPRVRKASERLDAHFGELSGTVGERLAGQALIKTYTAEEREVQRFRHEVAQHHHLVVEQSHLGHLVAAYGEVLVHLGTTIVIGYGGWLVMTHELTAGLMTRFLGYVVILYGPVRRFAELNITYQSGLSSMRRVFRLFDIEPSVQESKRPRLEPPTRGDVKFERVRFRFDRAERVTRTSLDGVTRDASWVLDGVSFDVTSGQRIAIVGHSGAGKTTLVSLLPRLYDATDGHILVDGVDVREYSLYALRSAIGIVQQDSFIFSGTVRDNIAYGRPSASDAEIEECARAANADEFIRRLPDGYHTWLGERGVNLSGGQRQRISIARALLKDPRILILDEATSALDTETESIVQQALERLMKGRTCLIIAHRLSTIRNADRILVLDEGHIVESGAHSELIGRGGPYARLVEKQSAV